MSMLDQWKNACRRLLYEKDLLSWVETMDGPDGQLVVIDGQQPGVDAGLEAVKAWNRDYVKVQFVLEDNLGEAREAVTGNPRYRALGRRAPCLERFQVIGEIISQLPTSSASQSPSDLFTPTSYQTSPILSLSHHTSQASSSMLPLPSLPTPRLPSPSPFQAPTKRPRLLVPQSSTPTPAGGISTPLAVSSRAPAPSASSTSSTSTPATSFPPMPLDRVYQPLSDTGRPTMNASHRRLLITARSDRQTWGKRCSRCGSLALASDPGFHNTFNCTVDHMHAATPDRIVTSFLKHPKEHLFVGSGPHQGLAVCFEWNRVRTLDGLCYQVDCQFAHRCSLCFSTDHRAFDCDTRQYLPIATTPRPTSMMHPDPARCYVDFHTSRMAQRLSQSGSSAATAASGSASPLVSASAAAAPFASGSTPPVPSTLPPARLLRGLTSAEAMPPPAASLPKWRIKDKHWDAVPRPRLPNLSGPSRVKPRSNRPIVSAPYRPVDSPLFLTRQIQQYPLSVPSSVQIRPGYHNRIPLDDIGAMVSEAFSVGFHAACRAASSTIPLSSVDAKQSIDKQVAFRDSIFQLERDLKLDTSAWDLPSFGKVGIERFQFSDGHPDEAGIVILANYPPAHRVGHAFTHVKDTSRHVGSEGLASATETANNQVAWVNTVPLFCEVQEGGSMAVPDEEGGMKRYPGKIIKHCISVRASEIMDRSAAGTSQWIFALGANPGSVIDAVDKLASAHTDYTVEVVEKSVRCVRHWEAGATSLHTLLLKQYRLPDERPVGINDLLFDHPLDREEGAFVVEDLKGRPQATDIKVTLTLLRHRRHPDQCIVLVKTCHPSATANFFGSSSLELACHLDLCLTMAEDLYFDRASSGLYPPPTWRSVRRKADAALFTPIEKTDESFAVALTEAQCELLRKLDKHLKARGRKMDPARLPTEYQRIHDSVTLVPATNGVAIDPTDVAGLILKVNETRLSRMRRLSASKSGPLASASQSEARSAGPSQSTTLANSTQSATRSSFPSPSAIPSTSSAVSPTPSPTSSRPSSAASNASSTGLSARGAPIVEGEPYDCICECGLVSTAKLYEKGTGRKVMHFSKVTAAGTHPVSAVRKNGDQCLMGIPLSTRAEAMACAVKQGKRQTTIELGSYADRVKLAWDKFGKE